MDPGVKIYTIDEFRCWKVENLDDERYDENKNEGRRYRVVSHKQNKTNQMTANVQAISIISKLSKIMSN